jgi:hypothetical protein
MSISAPFQGSLGIDSSTLRFMENINLTINGEPYDVTRTLKQRLFSLPWHPFKKTITVIPRIPDPNVYRTNGFIFGHPETLRAIRLAIDTNNHDQK